MQSLNLWGLNLLTPAPGSVFYVVASIMCSDASLPAISNLSSNVMLIRNNVSCQLTCITSWRLVVLYSGFLPPSKNMHVGLTGDSEIVLRSECGCLSRLSLCGLWWRPVQGEPRLSPDDRWDRLQPPRDPTDGLSVYRKWMDGWKTTFKWNHISSLKHSSSIMVLLSFTAVQLMKQWIPIYNSES